MANMDELRVSDEKKKYIVDLLNPTLEQLVTACIEKEADNPVAFMLDWLETKKASDEDKHLSPEEMQRLQKENEDLIASMAKVKAEIQETSKILRADEKKEEEEEEEEEDDEDDEPPPDFFKERPMGGARASVSAEAYGEWNTKKAFVAPVVLKTDEQKDRLKAVLSKSFLFSTLEDQDLTVVIGAMKEVIAEPKDVVIKQGDQGDFLFVIESGKLDCSIKSDGQDKVVKTCEAGDVFGELALLYNCPRAASVTATDKSVMWQLDRDTFNNIVKEAAEKKRQRYDNFLAKVPLLASMDAYERSQLADALKSEVYSDGDTVCAEGDVGAAFYIIEEGCAAAFKAGQPVMWKGGGTPMSYGPGDYFGELALLRNQPRAATVKASGATKLLTIDSRSFKRLLDVNALLAGVHKYS